MIKEYYSKQEVLEEIASFCINRWVAVHCEKRLKDGRFMLIRYESGKPLTFSKPSDIKAFIIKHYYLKPRSFYASCNIYRRLVTKDDALDYSGNVVARTPTWDIDSKIDWWKYTIEVARIVVDCLEKEGVSESVYLKWSGNGVHVHVHEKAISSDVLNKIGVFNAVYALVEYISRKIVNKVVNINKKYSVNIKVENLMDPQRVFTAPLSLHRELNVSCIVFKPEDLDSFEIDWTNPLSFKHRKAWRRFIEGEADELVWKAYRLIGPYPGVIDRKKVSKAKLKETKRKETLPVQVEDLLKKLRFCINPALLNIKRGFSSAEEALSFLENALSKYVLGEISLSKFEELVNYITEAVIPFQGLPEETKNKLIKVYLTTLEIVKKLKNREEVKKWLLSHGPSYRRIRTLDEFT
ncbi:MAG: hypothetical protein DRN04_04770 [Thermoprotei archaeon]|nr:MAG: hypothetical protein DRN04_04770 [Thermoprotei archaeon]